VRDGKVVVRQIMKDDASSDHRVGGWGARGAIHNAIKGKLKTLNCENADGVSELFWFFVRLDFRWAGVCRSRASCFPTGGGWASQTIGAGDPSAFPPNTIKRAEAAIGRRAIQRVQTSIEDYLRNW